MLHNYPEAHKHNSMEIGHTNLIEQTLKTLLRCISEPNFIKIFAAV